MNRSASAALDPRPLTLADTGTGAVIAQTALLASAVLLPIACHALQLPVRSILPMHWPVILAGLLYGWRTGALIGAFAPLLSFLVSGFPLPNILPSMTFELFVYGSAAGALRTRMNGFLAAGIAVAAGRLVFIASVLLTGRAGWGDTDYFTRALIPGLLPAAFQIVTLPMAARWLVGRYGR